MKSLFLSIHEIFSHIFHSQSKRYEGWKSIRINLKRFSSYFPFIFLFIARAMHVRNSSIARKFLKLLACTFNHFHLVTCFFCQIKKKSFPFCLSNNRKSLASTPVSQFTTQLCAQLIWLFANYKQVELFVQVSLLFAMQFSVCCAFLWKWFAMCKFTHWNGNFPLFLKPNFQILTGEWIRRCQSNFRWMRLNVSRFSNETFFSFTKFVFLTKDLEIERQIHNSIPLVVWCFLKRPQG
jgi:hypothetical protein